MELVRHPKAMARRRRPTFLSEDKNGVIILPNLGLSKSKIVNYTKAEKIAARKA